MKERMYRFVYTAPAWSVIVPESLLVKQTFSRLGSPDRILYVGEWDIVSAEDLDEDEIAP